MFTFRFHAFGWHSPKLALQIEFAPACSYHFVRSQPGQDSQFERTGAAALAVPQIGHEAWQFVEGQGSVVLDGPHFAACG